MFLSFWHAARWFVLAGSVFIGGMVCAMFIKQPFKDIGDLATWVGGVSTTITFIVTIIIATQDRRRARKEALSLAFVTGHTLSERVINLRATLMVVRDRLEQLLNGSVNVAAATGWAPQIAYIRNALNDPLPIDGESIEKLVVFGNNIAEHLAVTIALFETCQSLAKGMALGVTPPNQVLNGLLEKSKQAFIAIDRAHESLQKVLVDMARNS